MGRLFCACVVLLCAAELQARPQVVAVFGDMPYGKSAADTVQLEATPRFIDDINAEKSVSLAIHLGDIHSGKQPCTAAYDRAVLAQFQRLTVPLIYTPGDNEWMDCHKPGEGGGSWNSEKGAIDYALDAAGQWVDYAGGDPIENLALVRELYFPKAGHTLGRDKRVQSQATAYARSYPADGDFVENVRFVEDGVLYAFVNIPGGSNNGEDPWYGAPEPSKRQRDEIAARTGATIRWIEAAYREARNNGARAVVIGTQADLWDLDGRDASHVGAYEPYVQALAEGAKAYGRPVLLLVGDSHVYRSDNPFEAGSPCLIEPSAGQPATPCQDDAAEAHPGYHVANIHRVVVHGSSLPMEWLQLTVDLSKHAPAAESAFGPFAWTRRHP